MESSSNRPCYERSGSIDPSRRPHHPEESQQSMISGAPSLTGTRTRTPKKCHSLTYFRRRFLVHRRQKRRRESGTGSSPVLRPWARSPRYLPGQGVHPEMIIRVLVPLRPRPDCSGSLSSNTMEPTWSPTPYRCTPASTRRHQRCSQDSDDNSPNELALRPRAGPSTLIAHPKAAIDGPARQRQHRARLDQRRRSIGPGGRRTTVGDHGARR